MNNKAKKDNDIVFILDDRIASPDYNPYEDYAKEKDKEVE